MKFVYLVVTLLTTGSNGFLSIDYSPPLVFDPAFYVNTNPDLHGLHSIEEAKNHWISKGIKEGRQGCGSFHTKQYLHRYGDLLRVYGSNYHGAIRHYLAFGIKEHRLGYVEGGFVNRWTISNSKDIFISASSRMAGAVDSLVWNNKEFINAWDHGRELQLAMNTNEYAECFNPTEAGSAMDAGGALSSSVLQDITANGLVLKTKKEPAYWLPGGSHETANIGGAKCAKGRPSVAQGKVYHYPFSTQVEIGCFEMDNCIVFKSSIMVAGQWPQHTYVNFEAPTGYLTNDFQVQKVYDPATNKTGPYKSHFSSKPVLLHTSDNNYAMGVYAPPGQDSDAQFPMYYALWNFHGPFSSGTNKWDVVFRKTFSPGSTHTLHYVTYMCVGDVGMVIQCLHTLTHGH